MSSINGLGSNSPVQQTQNVSPKQPSAVVAESNAPAARTTDRLELSGVSNLMKTLKSNDVRADKVAAIRAQIENGTYDTDGKKLDAAMDGLLDDLTK
jgi:flagellar biosynthesis anti-sigma factor FlgM